MERLLNRRQQGDYGEASAIEWLTSKGAVILVPFGHSPHFDLVAEIDGQLLRIQVKTSTYDRAVDGDRACHAVSVATRGGNQSWSGVSKNLDPERFDLLFVVTSGGRRWLIPSAAIEGATGIHLGGPKYAEFEIERTRSLSQIVLASRRR